MTTSGNFVPAIGQSLVAETTNDPNFIAVGGVAQGYQTAPERAGEDPSEGTASVWMPAAWAAVPGNIDPKTIETIAADRVAQHMVITSTCAL
jgi:hypothetical protein